jgi:hypothetical protein
VMSWKTPVVMIIAYTFAAVPPALAQQGTSSQMPGMKGNNMASMDMQGVMKQCLQMRQQTKAGAPMNADMQKMMQQCDQMDRSMGSTTGGSDAPRPRTR